MEVLGEALGGEADDGIGGKYTAAQDRESAYEILKGRTEKLQDKTSSAPAKIPARGRPADSLATKTVKVVISSVAYSIGSTLADALFGTGRRQSAVNKAAKSVVRRTASSVGRNIGNEILRNTMGGLRR